MVRFKFNFAIAVVLSLLTSSALQCRRKVSR